MLPGLASLAGFSGDASSSFWIEASTDDLTKTGSSSGGSRTLTTTTVTITVHGGSGSPTFAWSRISGSSSITATAPTSATTAFSATLGAGGEAFAAFQCVVTDSSGAVQTVVVAVDLELVSYS